MCVSGRYWEKTKIVIRKKLSVCWNHSFCVSNVVLAKRTFSFVLNHPRVNALGMKDCGLRRKQRIGYVPCPHCRVRTLSVAANELKQMGQSSCLTLEKEVEGNMRSSWGFDLGMHAFSDSYTVRGCVKNMNRNGFSCVSVLKDVDTKKRKAMKTTRRTVRVQVQEWERKIERMIGSLTCFYAKCNRQQSQFDRTKWLKTENPHTPPFCSVAFSLYPVRWAFCIDDPQHIACWAILTAIRPTPTSSCSSCSEKTGKQTIWYSGLLCSIRWKSKEAWRRKSVQSELL